MKITIKLDEKVFEGEVSEVEVLVADQTPVEAEPVVTDVEVLEKAFDTETKVESGSEPVVEVAPEEVVAEKSAE